MIEELRIISGMFKDLTPYAVYGTLAYMSIKSILSTGLICLTICYVAKKALDIPKQKNENAN